MRVANYELIKIRSSLFGDICIVIINVIPMHGFQNQQHHSIVLRCNFSYSGLRYIDAELMQCFFILIRQLTHLHMLGTGHFIGIKQGLTDKIKINGHGQHIAINDTSFFVFNRNIAANNLFYAPHAAAQEQLIG